MKKILLFLIFTLPNFSYGQDLSDIGDNLVLLSGEIEDFHKSGYFIENDDLHFFLTTNIEGEVGHLSDYTVCVNISDIDEIKIERDEESITLMVFSSFFTAGRNFIGFTPSIAACTNNKSYWGGDLFDSKNANLILKLKTIINSIK